jgi:tetratricopeptide (TPR) repeat protein
MSKTRVSLEGVRARTIHLIERVADRPRVTVVVLAVAGLVVRQAWITTRPLAAGDWHWPSRGRMLGWFPWPSVWDSTLGFGGENRFLEAFRFPVFALSGAVAAAGGTWTVAEKVVYFLPYAVLLPVAGWLLAREILGRTRWTLLAPLILLGNTYFILESDGHVPLPLGELFGCLALVAFLKAMRRSSRWYAVIAGLLVSAAAVGDIRAAYITVWLMAAYLVVLVLAEPVWRLVGRRIVLSAIAGAAFIGTQLFWIVPLLTYHGHPGFPTPQSPNFNIITVAHGIAGVAAGWSGGIPAPLVQAPLNPVFMVLPLLALLLLVARRVRPEILWLALVAMVCAFLAKTNTPPLGGIYDLIYRFVPGFKLFREGSKFLFPVSVAYAVMAPAALQALFERGWRARPAPDATSTARPAPDATSTARPAPDATSTARPTPDATSTARPTPDATSTARPAPDATSTARPAPDATSTARPAPDATSTARDRLAPVVRFAAVAGVALVLLTMASTIVVLESGQVGSSTTPTGEPTAFSQMDKLLSADHQPGSVLWIGEPVFVSPGGKNHRYVITSSTHPAVNLTGNGLSTLANQRDDFQAFCATITQPYCYLQPGLFPYLVSMSGSSYIVSPGSGNVGTLPPGITRSWIRQQITAMFGPPMQLGRGGTTMLVWHSPHVPTIAGYPAVALVDSGSWSTAGVLPALVAMGVPAAYQQSFSRSNFPPAPSDLQDAVTVVPYLDRGYRSTATRQVGILAQTTADSLALTIDGSSRQLPLLTPSPRLPGWGLFGPLSLPAGFTSVTTAAQVGTIGPAVSWSPLTSIAFGDHPQLVGATKVGAHGERLSAPVARATSAWIELTRLYDPGWRLGTHRPVAPGDGLFNLYFVGPSSKARVTFSFSTRPWEQRGQLLAALSLLVALLALVRWRHEVNEEPPPRHPGLVGRLAQRIAVVGISLMGVTVVIIALQWVGWPSRYPKLTLGADPYTIDEFTGTLAMAVLSASIILRLSQNALRHLGIRDDAYRPKHARTAALAVALCLVATSCTGHGSRGAKALAAAQLAGSPSPSSAGESLTDAQLLQAARKPHACIADYTEALKSFPDLAAAYSGRASCYLIDAINPAGAVHDDAKALSLAPDNAGYYLNLAAAYRAIGNFATAIKDFSRGVAVPSSSPGDALTAVDAVLILGTPSQAEDIVQMAAHRFPNSAVVEVAAGDVAIAADNGRGNADYARAESLATGVNADEALVLGHLCRAQVLSHDYAAAVQSCAASAALSSNGAGAYDNLSAAYAALGQLDAAITAITAAIGARQGSAGPYVQLAGVDGFGLASLYEARGRLEIERHEPALAIADYKRARASLPGSSPDFRARLKADIKTAERD